METDKQMKKIKITITWLRSLNLKHANQTLNLLLRVHNLNKLSQSWSNSDHFVAHDTVGVVVTVVELAYLSSWLRYKLRFTFFQHLEKHLDQLRGYLTVVLSGGNNTL